MNRCISYIIFQHLKQNCTNISIIELVSMGEMILNSPFFQPEMILHNIGIFFQKCILNVVISTLQVELNSFEAKKQCFNIQSSFNKLHCCQHCLNDNIRIKKCIDVLNFLKCKILFNNFHATSITYLISLIIQYETPFTL